MSPEELEAIRFRNVTLQKPDPFEESRVAITALLAHIDALNAELERKDKDEESLADTAREAITALRKERDAAIAAKEKAEWERGHAMRQGAELGRIANAACARADEAERERDDWKHRVPQSWQREREGWEADEKRLRETIDAVRKRAERAEAECDRLRAALEEISDGVGCDAKYGPGCDKQCKSIAYRALTAPDAAAGRQQEHTAGPGTSSEQKPPR